MVDENDVKTTHRNRLHEGERGVSSCQPHPCPAPEPAGSQERILRHAPKILVHSDLSQERPRPCHLDRRGHVTENDPWGPKKGGPEGTEGGTKDSNEETGAQVRHVGVT